MNIENEATFRESINRGINLFVGAGFSVLARDKQGDCLPIGTKFLIELKKHFNLSPSLNLDLPQICTLIERTHRVELRQFLVERFSVYEFDERYKIIESLEIKTIFTTNIDNLLLKVFERSNRKYLNDIDIMGSHTIDENAIDMITLHGSVLDYNRPLRFSVPELSSAFRRDADKWYYLANRLERFPTLFWGYSLNDASTLQALNSSTINDREHREKWITLADPNDVNSGVADYYKAMGFNIIEADTDEFLTYLNSVIEPISTLSSSTQIRETRKLFRQESIPLVSEIPSRPIINFFLGFPPTWSDVFSGQIPKTSHYHDAKNAINKGQNVALVGTPACGKSTLLMQLAFEFLSNRAHVLMLNSVSREKAVFIDGRLANEPALIFLDNFTDSLDGFNYLTNLSNVTVIGTAQYYNFSMVRNNISSLKSGGLQIFEVSELSLADIQSCLSRIPKEIRATTVRQANLLKDKNNSLFEIIEKNIKEPTLKKRFNEMVIKLRENDPELLSLLLMFSYVDHCRTFASMDMVFAYLRDITNDYQHIHSMIEKLGKLVREIWGGDLDDGELQDIFSVRSNLVSSAIIDSVSGNELREMLEKFHDNISPVRIFRYDVFRRYAYDSGFIERAFPNWEDGIEFYKRLNWRDDSPFMLQQCALYLSKKEKYKEAFQMIDEANLNSGGRIPSIRNSHAIIVFRANEKFFREEDARIAMEGSMDELALCYESDNKRPFHAHRYAEQALSFYNFYEDATAISYLNTARQWLKDEVTKYPWDKKSKELLARVNLAVSS